MRLETNDIHQLATKQERTGTVSMSDRGVETLTQITKTSKPGRDGSSESCSISYKFLCVHNGQENVLETNILLATAISVAHEIG